MRIFLSHPTLRISFRGADYDLFALQVVLRWLTLFRRLVCVLAFIQGPKTLLASLHQDVSMSDSSLTSDCSHKFCSKHLCTVSTWHCISLALREGMKDMKEYRFYASSQPQKKKVSHKVWSTQKVWPAVKVGPPYPKAQWNISVLTTENLKVEDTF